MGVQGGLDVTDLEKSMEKQQANPGKGFIMCHSNNINTFGAKLTEAEGYSLPYSEKQAPSENA